MTKRPRILPAAAVAALILLSIAPRPATADDLFFDISDKHMTARGHRLVAADLARQIMARGLLRLD